jgi:hypothetical protein
MGGGCNAHAGQGKEEHECGFPTQYIENPVRRRFQRGAATSVAVSPAFLKAFNCSKRRSTAEEQVAPQIAPRFPIPPCSNSAPPGVYVPFVFLRCHHAAICSMLNQTAIPNTMHHFVASTQTAANSDPNVATPARRSTIPCAISSGRKYTP